MQAHVQESTYKHVQTRTNIHEIQSPNGHFDTHRYIHEVRAVCICMYMLTANQLTELYELILMMVRWCFSMMFSGHGMCSWNASQYHHKALEREQTSPSSWNKLKICHDRQHATWLRFLDKVHFFPPAHVGLELTECKWSNYLLMRGLDWGAEFLDPRDTSQFLLKTKGQARVCICYRHGFNSETRNKNQTFQKLHLEQV